MNAIVTEEIPAMLVTKNPVDSKTYKFVAPKKIKDIFAAHDWDITDGTQKRRYKAEMKPGAKNTAHLVTFSSPEAHYGALQKNIVMLNSHDRSVCFELFAGYTHKTEPFHFFVRIADADTKTRHRQNKLTDEFIEDSVESVEKTFHKIEKIIQGMRKVELEKGAQLEFAEHVLNNTAPRLNPHLDPATLISTLDGKETCTLWELFAEVHKNIFNGGLTVVTDNKKLRKVKRITNIGKTISLNQIIWETALEHLERLS